MAAQEIIFTFPDTIYAIKAEHILLKAGYHVQVMPVPPAQRSGCGLCLRLPPAQNEDAQKLLQQNELCPQQIYTRTARNGTIDGA